MPEIKLPTLFSARVMKDGAAFVAMYSSDQCGFKLKIKNGVIRIDLAREDVETLRDVLSVALAEH